MATIRAVCDEHGDIQVTSEDVQVRVCIDNGVASYAARCPEGDGHYFSQYTDNRRMELLIASGCRLERWRLPKELKEGRGEGDPIDHDFLLDIHETMKDENRIALAMGKLTREILYEEGLIDEIRRADGPLGDINNV